MTERICPGDLVLLYDKQDKKRYFYQIPPNNYPNFKYNTSNGSLNVHEIVEKGYNSLIFSGKNVEYAVLKPSLYEYIMFGLKRHTQIIYPKDSAYIALRMGIRENGNVIEIGTGSGAMTLILAQFAGNKGQIVTYEARKEFVELSKKNVLHFDKGLENRIIFKNRHILTDGIDETDIDNIFIDIREPQDIVHHCHERLRLGGSIGIVVATANQVSLLIDALISADFNEIEVSELFIRNYKTVSQRLRPCDSMVGHTAYVITAKKV